MQAQMDLRTETQQQFERVVDLMRGHVSEFTHKTYYETLRLGVDRGEDIVMLVTHRLIRDWSKLCSVESDMSRVYYAEFRRNIQFDIKVRTEVINLREVGDRGDQPVYIGRANRSWGLEVSEWANPFKLSQHKDKTRGQVIDMYRDWIVGQPVYAHVRELQGRRLACWCHPQSCHGDVLAELADATLQPRAATADGADGR